VPYLTKTGLLVDFEIIGLTEIIKINKKETEAEHTARRPAFSSSAG